MAATECVWRSLDLPETQQRKDVPLLNGTWSEGQGCHASSFSAGTGNRHPCCPLAGLLELALADFPCTERGCNQSWALGPCIGKGWPRWISSAGYVTTPVTLPIKGWRLAYTEERRQAPTLKMALAWNNTKPMQATQGCAHMKNSPPRPQWIIVSTHRHRGQTCSCQGGGGEGGMDWESGTSRCEYEMGKKQGATA